MTPKGAEVALYWIVETTEGPKQLDEIGRYRSWGAAMLDKDWIIRHGEGKPEQLALAWVARRELRVVA